MSRIVVFVGSMRKGGNTDLPAQAFAEGAGMVLVRGVKDIGDIKETKALEEAYNLGYSIR